VVKPAEEDEYEYVTVTKTRVVRTRPKVAVPLKASGTATKSAIISSTPVTQAKKSAIKSVAKKSTPSVKSANTVAADPNAPKVTTKRISNNVVETTVEKSGGSEAEVGIGGNQKVSKRKRKDGTEETVYTTTEVVKKKKVVK
jgi:hypothetical protein